MTIPELKERCEGKNVLVIGLAASGKTRIAHQIRGNHTIVHLDSFKSHGFEIGLYMAIEHLNSTVGPLVVEGVLGYRLLRKGLEGNIWKPDIVIDVQTTRAKREEIYRKERDSSKLKYIKSFDLGCLKVYNDYLSSVDPKERPEIIDFTNNW